MYASLAAALLSAFLTMLGKKWLNRYASTDVRGTSIERSQNRQRKLDGIVTWNFDRVMQSPPLMLQVALLLLGCELSLSAGDQYRRRIYCPWFHFFWHNFLPSYYCGRCTLRELPLSDACIPCSSPPGTFSSLAHSFDLQKVLSECHANSQVYHVQCWVMSPPRYPHLIPYPR